MVLAQIHRFAWLVDLESRCRRRIAGQRLLTSVSTAIRPYVPVWTGLARSSDPSSLGRSRLRAGLLIVLLMVGLATPVLGTEPDDETTLMLFWGEGCPHCAAEWEFLEELQHEFGGLKVEGYEVYNDLANRALFVSTLANLGMEPQGVPTTVLGEQVWVGFGPTVADDIRSAVEAALSPAEEPTRLDSEIIELPLLGPIEIAGTSLMVATVLIALVDGINPCSLWVLSILLALVLRSGSRRRVLAIGGTFLVVTTLLYGLYTAGLYGFLAFANQAWVRVAMALVALGFGVVNLRDYFRPGAGFSLSIPESRKPGLYRRMRMVSATNESLGVALVGTGVLAVGVSVLETPCTAGYPLLWSNLLAGQQVGLMEAFPLFALYMLVFLFDELVVFGAAVVAMRATKLEERAGRVLKLVGGAVMVALAGALLFVPEAMYSVAGALAVFAVALIAVAIILIVERSLTPGGRPGKGREGDVCRQARSGSPPGSGRQAK